MNLGKGGKRSQFLEGHEEILMTFVSLVNLIVS